MTDSHTKRSALALILIVGALIACCFHPGLRRPGKTTAVSGKTEISWIIPLDLNREDYEQLLKEFGELHPEIQVKPLWVPASQYHTKFKTLVAADIAPDIFFCGDVWVAYLRPFLRDLSPLIQRDKEELGYDDFYPQLWKNAKFDGKYFFVPHDFNISLLYYNKKLFDQAGQPYPSETWTWQDYSKAGQAISALLNAKGEKIYGSTILTGWWGEWLTMVRQNGGDMFDAAITTCTLNRPEAVEALSFYKNKIDSGISPQPGHGPARGFEGGRFGMEWGGHTGNWYVYNEIKDLDWDIQMLPMGPSGKRGCELAMEAYGISRTCKHPEEAWTLVKFMTSPHALELFAKRGMLVARKSVATKMFMSSRSAQRPHNIQAVYKSLDYAMPIPQTPDFIELAIETIQPEIDLLIAEDRPAQEVAEKATEAANAFIRTMGKKQP